MSAKPAYGDTAVLLIDAESLPNRCLYARSYVAWFEGDWQIQPALPDILKERDVFNRSAYHSPAAPEGPRTVGPRAIVEASPSGLDLGVIYLVAGGCGSGPTEAYVLLHLEGDHWQRSWDSLSDTRTSFGHTNVDFAADDLGTLRISGDSWSRFDDLGNVFHESNPGPHRYFEQTWLRQGGTYELSSETVTPSPYNTLVNFVHDIGVNDTSAADALVTDSTLVQTAIDLGLAKDPAAAPWTGLCGAAQTPPPCEVDLPSGEHVQVDMVQSGDSWLVSGVGPAPSTAVPTSSNR